MPIAALPAQTVRVIGSSQALTDAASLLKELIDNAIDARATTISVDISANTLNDIRIKDNGYGINPEDRPLVCERHCTSKIRGLDELQTIGGRSLGFRGVALASVAELSGCLTISTRIEGEQTASELQFDRQGKISRYESSHLRGKNLPCVSEKRTSLPVGTTVRVERFLEALPVRRQAAEKNPAKVLARLKRILQSYVLARPQLRLSLKILKAKDEKANWKYPTSLGHSKLKTNPFNAATDVVGKKITDQCQWYQSCWPDLGEQNGTPSKLRVVDPDQPYTYTFDAILANPDCGMFKQINQYTQNT